MIYIPTERQESIRRSVMTEEIPKSRIVPLGTGELPAAMNQFEYMNLVYDSKLTQKMTHVLGYLAIRYNFTERRATMMGQRRAANDLKMERKTYRKATMDLEQWGWVKVRKVGPNKPDRYTLMIGNEIVSQEWTEPLAKKTQLQNERNKIEDDF